MLLIECPWCGARPEGEFICLGEAVAPRPDPQALGDEAWSAYVSGRANARGPHDERWWHQRSCGRIIRLTRDTATHRLGPGWEESP